MFYQKFNPATHLSPFVECYFVWENQDSLAQSLRVESPPTGFGSMVFNYGDPYRVDTGKYTERVAPAAFLTGQATHSYHLDIRGRIGMVGIVFKPAGINSLFGLPMYEFTDERTSLPDVLGNTIQTLHDQLRETNSPDIGTTPVL